jgi:hypothetical protein
MEDRTEWTRISRVQFVDRMRFHGFSRQRIGLRCAARFPFIRMYVRGGRRASAPQAGLPAHRALATVSTSPAPLFVRNRLQLIE